MAPLTPADPQRLGRYWLAGRLGAGGQGVVYEAYGEAGERVAVKVPRLDDRAALGREAAAAQRVASFCTARVIEVDLDVPYIVSEYVPGPNLRQVGRYDGDALRRLAIGVATALTAIHQAGVVHRDLKPDNIIVGPDGPRVIDFGVAREVGPTTTSPVMGTPNYMAPEVWAGRGATPAADVWAWGLVMLFAACGRDAVSGQDPASVLDFVPDLSGLPDPLEDLVASALARDPQERPTARALLLGLLGGSDDPLADGGVQAAKLTGPADPDLGEIAEELFDELSEAERELAPEVFLRMLDGEGSVRRVPEVELAGAEPVVALFEAAGLIGAHEGGYVLVRPGLVQAWPRMRRWVADNRAGLPIHRRLTEAALVWDGHGRKPGDLLHGSVLDTTLRWAATERRDISLMNLEKEFLDSAARQTRRQSRRRGALAAALAVLLVLALGGIGLAEYRRATVDRQRDDLLGKSLAQRAADLRESDPRLAMLLSAAAWRLAPALPEARAALDEALSQRYADAFTDPDQGPDTVYAVNRDGRLLAAVDGGRVRVWDVRQHRQVASFGGVSPTAARAALTPDGRTLALMDERGVQLWTVSTGQQDGPRFAAAADGDLAFDAAGRLLAVPGQWWDVRRRVPLRAPSGAPLDAVSGSYGMVSTTGRGRVELWDLRSGRRVDAPWLPDKQYLDDLEFAGDGRTIAFVEATPDNAKRRVVLKHLPVGDVREWTTPGDAGRSLALGDRLFAHWSLTGRLVVQRLSDGMPVVDRQVGDALRQVRFDDADRALRMEMDGGRVVTLDLSAVAAQQVPGFTALSPDGRTTATQRHSEVRLTDLATARQIGPPLPSRAHVLAFSQDGRRLALGDGPSVTVVDAATGRVLTSFRLANRVDELVFVPGGDTLAVASSGVDGLLPMQLWNLRTGTATPVDGGSLIAVRPDGRLLVTGDGTALVDPSTGAKRRNPLGRTTGPLAFSPDGKYFAVAQRDRLSLWDADLTTRLADLPAPGDSTPVSLAWSPDSRTLAAYEFGDRLRLWDVPSRQSLGVVLAGLTDPEYGVASPMAFTADGRTLVNVSPEGTVRRFPLDPAQVVEAVCRRAGRALTPAERTAYLPEAEPFDPC
ncbi:protein kinase [Nonomuraea sp. NPDC050556]|uniref:protein kinase domain-containing protein n=1 Tax=Nonomuraea sp. NPDC050556 TaxID=3364369 RepID=UPI0037BC9E0D